MATFPDSVENLRVAQRQGHQHMLAGTDLRRVEKGVDQPCPGPRRQVTGLNVQGGSSRRPAHELDVGSGHAPPVLIFEKSEAVHEQPSVILPIIDRMTRATSARATSVRLNGVARL